MLGEGRAALITHPHTSLMPGMMIFTIVMGINLLGDGIRDALDPRLAKGALRRALPLTKIDRDLPLPRAEERGLLSVSRLKTDFQTAGKTIKAIRDVSFHIGRGECLALVGEVVLENRLQRCR